MLSMSTDARGVNPFLVLLCDYDSHHPNRDRFLLRLSFPFIFFTLHSVEVFEKHPISYRQSA